MLLALLPIALGLAAGLARGGSVGNLGRLRLNGTWLAFTALALQAGTGLAIRLLPGIRPHGLLLVAGSYLLVIAFVVRNRRLPGAVLVALGLALNLVVIVGNGAMPVSRAAAEAAGLRSAGELDASVKHRLMDPGTRLRFLGDVIPLPVFRRVVSIGDAVLAAGLFVLVERTTSYRPRRVGSPDVVAPDSSDSPSRHEADDPAPPDDLPGGEAG
ncbi:MAG: DUF5317 domain-containing protein [Actinomycetota bacterium]